MNRIFVAGHRGMVGKAVCRRLATEESIETVVRSREILDLTNPNSVADFFDHETVDTVVFCAARVGGIFANNAYPVEFMSDNLLMQLSVIRAAYAAGVKRFLFLGSTCIYPRDANQPLVEDALLTGPLEKTNEAYALAKICGLKLCEYYRRQYGVLYHSAMPTNLYGPGDNYHPEHSHVLPALLRRFHEAQAANAEEVVIWGTGTPKREFLHVDDLADALFHLLKMDNPPDWVNVGTGEDCSILEVAQLIAEVVGFRGRIVTDPTKPDGTPRKVTDVSRLNATGWKHSTRLRDGLRSTYADFLNELTSGVRER
jgi:GDP-L-fucose synthase